MRLGIIGDPTAGEGGFSTEYDQTLLSKIYSWFRYGSIPSPQMPVPNAPQTGNEMTAPGAWTPEIERRAQIEAYNAALRQRIAEAEREGSYSPDAVLTAENLERAANAPATGMTAAFIAAGVLATILIVKR